jgi:hypothetical protein
MTQEEKDKLLEAAKREENLKSYIQKLIDIRTEIADLNHAHTILAEEKQELL